uniref:Uncharacterized protein n=1 Tax=Leptobrachium leishanense TaxID=445787 RepID=A0A8C5LW85_9ANUR
MFSRARKHPILIPRLCKLVRELCWDRKNNIDTLNQKHPKNQNKVFTLGMPRSRPRRDKH